MKYSEAIKKVRNIMFLTQEEFADYLHVSFESVNRWENGKYNPTMKTKRQLASLFKKYNIEVDYE